MSANYYLMDHNSESVANILATPSAYPATGVATNSQTVVKSTTTTLRYITPENIPANTSWGTRAITATFKITTANTNITFAITPYRVNSAGTIQQTGTTSPTQTATATGNLTCTCAAFAFTAGSDTDRLAVDVAITNTNSMTNQTVAFEINTVNSFITSPIPEWSGSTPGTVAASGQYSSSYAAVAIGSASSPTTDGNTTPLWLETDVYSKAPAYNTTAGEEAKIVGTSFSNTADITNQSRALREQSLPTSRRGAVMGYDSVNKRYITTGGYDGTNRFTELWELSADGPYSRFHLLSPSVSGTLNARNLGASVMLCGANGKVWFIYFGGANTSGAGVNELDICDCTTRGSEAWTASITQTNAPTARDYNTFMMFARPTGTNTFDVYHWGGWTQAGPRAFDMFVFSVNMASTVPTSVTWTTVTQSATKPSSVNGRSGSCIVYDSLNDRAILFGGYDGTTYFADLWKCTFNSSSNVTWVQLSPTGTAPAVRELACCGYDVTNQRMIVFGGWASAATTSDLNDIVSIGLTAGSESFTTIRAQDANNFDFIPMSSGCACVDTNRKIIVSWAINGYDSTDKYVYAFDLNFTGSSNAPMYGLNVIDDFRGRDGISYCVDTTRSVALNIGGYSTMDDDTTITRGDHENQLWAYSWTNNTLRYSASGWLGFPFHEGSLTVYDSVNDRVILFAGLTGTAQVGNAVWELKPDANGNYKARLMWPSGTLPGARFMCHGAFDSANKRMVIWGGKNATALLIQTDMWALDLSNPANDGTWSQLTPTGTGPSAGFWQGGFAYDDTNHLLWIAGGCTNQSDSTYSSTLYKLNLTTTNPVWSTMAPTGSITASRGIALAIDVTNGYLWGFGGYGGGVVNSNLYNYKIATNTWTTVTATGGPPEARRSAGGYFANSKFYVSCGRPVTGRWYCNWWELTPNYVTLNSSSWANKVPTTYQKDGFAVTGKTNNNNYHWQSVSTINGTATSWASFGNNTESSTDFTIGTVGGGYNVKLSSMMPFFYP